MSSSYAVDGEPPFFSNKERGLEESELFEDMSVLGGFRL
jgi:hypothetical protein